MENRHSRIFQKVNHCSDELYSQLDLEVTLIEGEKGKLRNLVIKYNDVFAKDPSELGRTNVVQHTIDTGTHPPIKQLPHRTPFSLRKWTEELIESMLKQGVITNSNSPWASPVVLVAKKDGSTSFCVDYRKLNAITKLDSFPLPRVDDSLDLLANTAYFSSLDLASGYWQVGMVLDSNCILFALWTLRVYCDAFWSMQRSSHFPEINGDCSCWTSSREMYCLP